MHYKVTQLLYETLLAKSKTRTKRVDALTILHFYSLLSTRGRRQVKSVGYRRLTRSGAMGYI